MTNAGDTTREAGARSRQEERQRGLALALVLSLLLIGLYVTSTRPALLAHRSLSATARQYSDELDKLRDRARYLGELKRGLEVDAITVERAFREVYEDAAEPGEKKLEPRRGAR
jgi:hypothetical protein